MNKSVILLTACIHPNGMSFTQLTSSDERMKQYINALNFYIQNTSLPIVFVENTNTDISDKFKQEIQSDRLEVLTFSGNDNKQRGKGYGEAKIIKYALDNSRLLSSNINCIIKITGRLIVKNLNVLINVHKWLFVNKSIQTSINSDLSFADSRMIIAPAEFYRLFIGNREMINDSKNVFFEHILAITIREQSHFNYIPFFVEPQIIGSSGSTGKKYEYKLRRFNQKIVYFNYSLGECMKFGKTSAYQVDVLNYLLLLLCHLVLKMYCKIVRC